MKRLYLLTLLLVIVTQLNAQNWQWQWANKYTNITNPYPERMLRHNDHLVITGSIDFPTTGIFIMMTDTSGTVLWTETSTGIAIPTAVTTDNTNIYVAGRFNGTMTLGSTTLTSAGSYDGFIVALDMNGNVVWAQSYGGVDEDRITDIIMHNNQLYMLAAFENTAVFAPQTLTSTGGPNLLLAQFDAANGNLTWHTVKDISFTDEGRVRITSTGNFIISGNFWAQLNADTISLYSGGPDPVPFLLMLNSAGTAQWAKELTGYSFAYAQEMELDIADSIYLDIESCYTPGCDSDLNKYPYNSSTPSWSQSFDRPGYGSNSFIGDIEISGMDIYVTGIAHNAEDYGDPNDDTTQLVVMQYTSTGAIAWADTSVLIDYTSLVSMAKGAGNELYVVGVFRDTIVFGGDTLTSPGAEAMFIAKIAQPVITGIVSTKKHDRFDVYPNPSNRTFVLNGRLDKGGETQLFIRNIQGQVVYADQFSITAGEFNASVQTTALSNGLYFIELVIQGNIYRQKMVIEKQ